MIIYYGIISLLLKVSFLTKGLDEGPIQEIKLINFTDWGWLLFISGLILVVWLLIVFQARSPGSQGYGPVSEPETNNELSDHIVGDPTADTIDPNG